MENNMLELVVDKLIALLGPIATLSKEKRELKDNALRSISTALRETQLYYRSHGREHQRNMDTEAQLVRYWSAAAIPLRHIDEELAAICDHKADYWLNPEQWSDEDVVKFGIKLENVARTYQKLVAPRYSMERKAVARVHAT
jgi:hypothetical protein